MEKELTALYNLETQLEKIAELVAKLKEENKQLRTSYDQLLIQTQSVNRDNTVPGNNINDTQKAGVLTEYESEIVRRCVTNALMKLDQLRKTVMEAS
jgi:hypothetical protein